MTPRRLILDERNRVAAWVLERIGHPGARWGSLHEAIGVEAGGRLVAGAVFDDYVRGGSIRLHIAALPGACWASREVLRAGFLYAFRRCDVRRITALVADRNVRCQRFIERLGFEHEGTMKNALPSDSERVYGLLRENCRFLE
jgi:RimJ/RimL family protein N-acetyltransferase